MFKFLIGSFSLLTVLVFAEGQRIRVGEKGFSIIPPPGWDVVKDHPNLSLVLQIPETQKETYRRTIQVAVGNEKVFIDDISAKQFQEKIESQFSSLPGIGEYRIRSQIDVNMLDGRKGHLFYAEFESNGKRMMQAHIVVSSESRFYLLTYTDLADHFEKEEHAEILAQAWDAMISVELDSPTPVRFKEVYWGLGFISLLALVLFSAFFQRKRGLSRRMEEIANGNTTPYLHDDESDLVAAHNVKSQNLQVVTTEAELVTSAMDSMHGDESKDDYDVG